MVLAVRGVMYHATACTRPQRSLTPDWEAACELWGRLQAAAPRATLSLGPRGFWCQGELDPESLCVVMSAYGRWLNHREGRRGAVFQPLVLMEGPGQAPDLGQPGWAGGWAFQCSARPSPRQPPELRPEAIAGAVMAHLRVSGPELERRGPARGLLLAALVRLGRRRPEEVAVLTRTGFSTVRRAVAEVTPAELEALSALLSAGLALPEAPRALGHRPLLGPAFRPCARP